MKLGGLEKFSGVDFDGKLACTLFTVGCNFRCPFCHNSPLVIETEENITEQEFFDFLQERKHLLNGVCISGGEPTLQKDLIEFISKIKKLGFAVKLDTNGTNPTILQELIASNLIDYVAMDIKNCFNAYSDIIGLKNYDLRSVKKSVEILKKDLVDYEFRTTLVREYHTLENIIELGEDIKGAKKLFLQKFKPADTCLEKDLTEVSKADAELFKDILSDNIPQVKLRGY
ncbi:MAG: anaerobic ribonucleoside-triphosphate reductase activating protein [Clostridia bacterium]|nr:anaerobic ribonucleoside-triphosphate reductase activating protein [Clostridia bacterium]